MDDADRAQIEEERLRAAALEKRADAARGIRHYRPKDPYICARCQQAIDKERAELGYMLCLACAEERDRWAASGCWRDS